MYRKTVIGCSASYDDERIFREKIIEPIHKEGQTIIFFSHTKNENVINQYLDMVDGILIGGGIEDICPKWFVENIESNCTRYDELRDDFEMKLIKNALVKRLPILGICRGLHILNMAAGGSLYQDILIQDKVAQFDHMGNWIDYQKHVDFPNIHKVMIEKDTLLRSIIRKEELVVNSYHHQSIKKIADDFVVSAISMDRVIEGIESKSNRFVLGVQWHPELDYHIQSNKNIFVKFVAAAIEYQKNNS